MIDYAELSSIGWLASLDCIRFETQKSFVACGVLDFLHQRFDPGDGGDNG